MFAGFNLFPDPLRPFSAQYRCYSVSMLPGQERADVDKGGKIIMPPSALDQLTRLNVVYPMLFKLANRRVERLTHCGVLEFVADEGKVYLPYWMMRNLLLDEGGLVSVESVTLPVASYSKFQPQSTDFLDITNPKAVLENALRNFACLTTGDVFAIVYNQKMYEFCVLKTEPGSAVSIIECDMNVEFAAPVGYQEPSRTAGGECSTSDQEDDYDDVEDELEESTASISEASACPESAATSGPSEFLSFQGTGARLDGKQRNLQFERVQPAAETRQRGLPDFNYKIGSIRFMRRAKPKKDQRSSLDDSSSKFVAFSGEGRQLKPPKHNRGV